nr:hypothetical protein [Tanacetum cinerariifolium]
MHDCVQLDYVVDSHDDYTSDSNVILCDQYVKDNEVPVIHSDLSYVPDDAFMMIYDDMCEPHDQPVSYPSRNTAVKNPLTTKLATYKEHVELYEQRAKFELTEREQKINEQLRIVISDRNFKEETLKRKLHSIKFQLASTINHNKSMVEEVSFLKKDFKQKENKYLADFLDIKTLKEKVEDKLIKQDQSLQTVYMLVFSVATKSELNVTRFDAMHVVNTSVEARCLALEAELATLLKVSKPMDSIGNIPPTPDKDTPDFDSVFIIGKMQASLQGKENAIHQLKKQLSKLKVTSSDTEPKNVTLKTSVSKAKVQPPVLTRTKHAVDVEPIVSRLRNNRDVQLDYLRHLKESVETIYDIVEEAKVALNNELNSLPTLLLLGKSKLLLPNPLKPSDRQDSNKQVHVVAVKPQKTNVPVPPSIGVNSCPNASGSQPKSHVKPNRISPAKGDNKLPVDDQPRKNKSYLRTSNHIDSSSRLKRTVIKSHSDSICQTCNKCLTPFNHDLCVATCLQSAMATSSIRHNSSFEQKVKQV